MPTWPVTLPPEPSADGYQERYEDRRIVFQNETGPASVRASTSVGLRTIEASYAPLAQAQRATLLDFYRVETQAGVFRFDVAHPRLGTTAAARFVAPPRLSPFGGGVEWSARLVLDVLLSPPPAGTGSLAWPTSLPLYPLVDAYNEAFGEDAIRDDLQGGNVAVRRRSTATPARIEAQFRVTGAQAATFDGFYEADTVGGALAFTWPHPILGDVRAAFSGGPTLRALGGDVYVIALALELLP